MTDVVFKPAAYWPRPSDTLASKFLLLGVRRPEHFTYAEIFGDDFDGALDGAFAQRDLALVLLVALAKERSVADVRRLLAEMATTVIAHASSPSPDELRVVCAALSLARSTSPDRGLSLEVSETLLMMRGARVATTAVGHIVALGAQHTHVGAGARVWVACELLIAAVMQTFGELGARPVIDELLAIARAALSPENDEAERPASPSAS